MSEVVSYNREGNIGVITVNYPPVNALGQAVRSGLLAALEQGQKDAEARALLLVCEGRTFIAGADIREFGKPMQEPTLPTLVNTFEDSDKPRLPRSMAPPWVVVWKPHGAVTTGLRSAVPRWACRKSSWAFCPVPAAHSGFRA